MGLYTGKVLLNFKITPLKLTEAVKQKLLTIEKPAEPVLQNMAGAKGSYTLTYHADSSNPAGEALILKEGTDYTITFQNNKTVSTDNKKAGAIVKGKGNYTGTQIRPVPEITVKGTFLKAGVHYTLTYEENTGIGRGSVTITGIPENGYIGMKKINFTILPKWLQWLFR